MYTLLKILIHMGIYIAVYNCRLQGLPFSNSDSYFKHFQPFLQRASNQKGKPTLHASQPMPLPADFEHSPTKHRLSIHGCVKKCQEYSLHSASQAGTRTRAAITSSKERSR